MYRVKNLPGTIEGATIKITDTNGSDDMISSMRCVYYKVDSKLSLFRKNKYLNNNQVIEPEEVAKTYCLK